jgi:hypothetical protein
LERGIFFRFQKCERRQQIVNRTILKDGPKFSIYKFERPVVRIVFDSDLHHIDLLALGNPGCNRTANWLAVVGADL